jgi:hypothetical protein
MQSFRVSMQSFRVSMPPFVAVQTLLLVTTRIAAGPVEGPAERP